METGSINGANNQGANIFAAGKTKFSDNPFLQLLVTQLRSQSPLDPVKNNDMVMQMSQLSSMEQQRELNDNLLNLLQFQGALARLSGLTQGTAMLGKEVQYIADENGTKKSGKVESVSVGESGEIKLLIGGKEIPLSAVTSVKDSKTGGSNKTKTKK
jgi:flagellar basal-body rod modification protein FlgD